MKIIFKYLFPILILFTINSIAQVSNKIKLNIDISTTGDRAKVFEDQVKSYIQIELLKIPDVKITSDDSILTFYISIFQLPCNCEWVDFYYRAHFLTGKILIGDPHNLISEGFESYNSIEKLAKGLVAHLNANYLSTIRE